MTVQSRGPDHTRLVVQSTGPPRDPIVRSGSLLLFTTSALALFLEMLLIRWIGTEVRIFAYLQNTILIVSFLGVGLGCFTCDRPITLTQTLAPLTVLLVLLAIPFTRGGLLLVSPALSVLDDLVTWGRVVVTNPWTAVLFVSIGLAISYLVLILVVDLFVPIGRIIGRLMNRDPSPIRAYSANIAGSLAGTWLFVLLSAWYQPPITWFVVVGLSILVISRSVPVRRPLVIGLVAASLPLAWFAGRVPGSVRTTWSPYQKLSLDKPTDQSTTGIIGDYLISVNNTGYQMMADLSQEHVAREARSYPADFHGLSQYDLPLLLHPHPRRYLVVGAGAGNDVAGGLRGGATEITAVEIDPAIIQMGREFHPERPYASPLVTIVNDDARSFFATTTKRFDVITFGLLDSHTTTSMTNARLDSYVYTRESLEQARRLLAGGGIMFLSFEAQKPFIADRMARALRDVFGQAPLAFQVRPSPFGWGGVMFVEGDLGAARHQIAANPNLSAFLASMEHREPLALTYTTRVTTDDWPYTYLQTPRIPVLYYLLTALMLAIGVRSARRWGARDLVAGWDRTHWHFFFLGAAFLLLEVQNISKASVVLGNTWDVNAVIVSGVLVMALAANGVAARFPRIRLGAAYAVLVGSCLALYFVDLARFAFLPYPVKAVVVGALTTCPMFFSGIAFVRAFAEADRKSQVMGANLAGALVGALLQSLTFVIGIKALLLVVAALYVVAFVSRPAASVARVQSLATL